jgi:hypothetical protein
VTPVHTVPSQDTPRAESLQPPAGAEADAADAARAEKAARVLRRFRMVFNAVKTHFQQVEKQAGIGGAQVWA